MDHATYENGLQIRKAVLGDRYVDEALAQADEFNAALQDLVTEYCWGAVWGRDGLSRKERSMLNIAMLSVLNRQHELSTHIRGARTNGVNAEQIREILLQVAVYAGVPAAVDAFRTARQTLASIGES